MIRHIVVLLLCVTSIVAQADVTEVTATVDRNPVMVDESFTLQVVANDSVENDAFDPSPLLKDFVVGRTSVSTQTKIVNFDTSRTTTWTTVVIPRQPGRYTIPSFEVAGQHTQPINLMVIPASASNSSKGRDLFITTEVDTSRVYLQQQIRYVAKLHLAVDLQRGSLEAPKLPDAEIRQIGKDKEYSQIDNGRRYRIIERTFAIIPQKSGTFRIDGPLFEGEIVSNNRQSFGFFNRTQTVNRVGKAIDIEVLPVPDNISYHWLPSDFVELHEEWQSAENEYRVGDPITRILTLTAVGLVEEQLPEINSQYPEEVKTYPDQATTSTVERDSTLIAQRQETVAIIPSQAGTITIPEVSIPWFNVVTQQTEYARLPARTIEVLPSLQQQNTLPQVSQPAPEPNTAQPVVAPTPTTPSLWSLSSWILLALWLLTLILWWYSRRNTVKKELVQPPSANSNHWPALQKALKQNDAKEVLSKLTLWLAEYCQRPGQSLAQSQQQLQNTELNRQIDALLSGLFGKQASVWHSDALQNVLKQLYDKSAKPVKNSDFQLKGLYPDTAENR